MKIVLAIDSFKGSLTSAEAGTAAIEAIRTRVPDCQTELIPIADGGEGMLSVMLNVIEGTTHSLEAHNPCMERTTTSYGISPDGHIAFIEMASISGLPPRRTLLWNSSNMRVGHGNFSSDFYCILHSWF